jgi:hypothetical protein
LADANKPATPPRPAVRPAASPAVARPVAQSVSTPTASRPAAAATTQLAADLNAAGRQVLDQAIFGKRPYLRAAFFNPYNLSLLGGGIAASVLTMNPLPAILTLGLEGLWLLHAPDSKRLRHILWDPRFEQLRKTIESTERAQRMQGLPGDMRQRIEGLVARREQIQRLAATNPSFAGDLLRGELVKTDKLVDAFLEMGLTCSRYEAYLAGVDEAQLERDRQRYERAAQVGDEDPRAAIAKKNLAIVQKREEKMQEIRKYLSVARGQLDLIENSFQLIADQIVTMQSPQELSGQLDELLDGVEAIRQTTRETEKILGTIEREM